MEVSLLAAGRAGGEALSVSLESMKCTCCLGSLREVCNGKLEVTP